MEQAGAVVLAISPQDVDSHERWAAREGFRFPMLADVDLAVAESYGVRRRSSVKRTVFLVDGGGTVRHRLGADLRAIFYKPSTIVRDLARID
ncbi:MAG: redoxin domain-containing protein [Acidimicrobiia bacterium]|nr:redoxin domain-containing protein [Acidimicrobiia bacterium]